LTTVRARVNRTDIGPLLLLGQAALRPFRVWGLAKRIDAGAALDLWPPS
jgi:hypothetical protein